MEEAYVIIYYCYGLNFKTVSESDKDKEIEGIVKGAAGEAGKDGRNMSYVGCVPKKDFSEALIGMLN